MAIPTIYFTAALLLCSNCCSSQSYDIHLNCKHHNTEKLEKFWTNTGFSPPGSGDTARSFLTSSDVKMNLFLIGSVPFNGVSHIRIHWLLDLVKLTNPKEKLVSNMEFDFTLLDEVLSTLNEAKLSPGFEIMGFPQHISAKSSAKFWNGLISKILERYIHKFGLNNVRRWRMETWNEPDLKMYNILNFTSIDYLDYFRGVSEAMRQFNLSIGGPAGLFKNKSNHKLCWNFLDHCHRDENLCSLAFISFHKKGNSDVKGIIKGTKILFKEVSANYSELKSIPFANSESDFLSGWWRNEAWRADVRYAAAIAESIITHPKLFNKAGFQLSFLSHDNAFLNFSPHFFTQRTLLARFQMNYTNRQHYSQFFRKPALNVLILLALLEAEKITVKQPDDQRYKIIATRSTDSKLFASRISVLIVLNDAMHIGPKRNIQISLTLPRMKEAKYRLLMLDNSLLNPSSIWRNAGSPPYPDKTLRNEMRSKQELYQTKPVFAPEITMNISLHVSLPSVTLIHICSLPLNVPGKVTNLRFFNITFNEVMIFWSDEEVASRCLKTFEVHFKKNGCSEYANFTQINVEDSLFLSYQFAPSISSSSSESVRGCYKVRAIDYWDRPGFFSDMKEYYM